MILVGLQSDADSVSTRHQKSDEERSLISVTSSCYEQMESTKIRLKVN